MTKDPLGVGALFSDDGRDTDSAPEYESLEHAILHGEDVDVDEYKASLEDDDD